MEQILVCSFGVSLHAACFPRTPVIFGFKFILKTQEHETGVSFLCFYFW